MLLKLKICTTVLVIYEILAVLLLHCNRTCYALFGMGFCDDAAFKYFIACFAIPAIVWLIVMWIYEIIHGARHRHSFMYRAKHAVHDAAETVRDRIRENVSAADLEKLLAAAVLVGIKKYVSKHPHHRAEFKRVLESDLGDVELSTEFDADDEDDEYEDNDTTRRQYTSDNRRGGKKNNSRTSRKK